MIFLDQAFFNYKYDLRSFLTVQNSIHSQFIVAPGMPYMFTKESVSVDISKGRDYRRLEENLKIFVALFIAVHHPPQRRVLKNPQTSEGEQSDTGRFAASLAA